MSLTLCSSNLPNAGAPLCDKSRGIPRYLVIGDKEFLPADYVSIAAFKAAFKAATLLARGTAGKLIVLPLTVDVANKTAADKTGTLNQGFTEVLLEGFPAFDLGVQISNRHAQILRGLNGQNVNGFIFDQNFNGWGTMTATPGWRGEAMKLFVPGDNFTDGQSSKVVAINVAFTNVVEFKNSSRYFTVDFNVGDYGNLKDVDLTIAVASVANVHNITGKIKTGAINKLLDIYLDYSTALANAARWTCVNNQTGAAFTITSVATNAGGYWVVTLDSTAWTALGSGDSVTLNYAAPSVLDAAGATGIEGVAIVLTKP